MLKARVTFRVMKLGRYVTVDDGGNYVTERSHKDKKKIITPHNESLGRLCSAAAASAAALSRSCSVTNNISVSVQFQFLFAIVKYNAAKQGKISTEHYSWF